jgi:hypothetical protein
MLGFIVVALITACLWSIIGKTLNQHVLAYPVGWLIGSLIFANKKKSLL